jgi:hypothetical protein
MQHIKQNQIVTLELTVNMPDGEVMIFNFVDQLMTRVHDEINLSVHGIGMSIEHTEKLINDARKKHKATKHYEHHIAELVRLRDTFVAANDEAYLNEQDNELRQLEMAA